MHVEHRTHPRATVDPFAPPELSAQGLHLRPVVPQDDLLLAELVAGLSPQARRQRFHGAFKLSFTHIQQMCRLDPQRQRAWVVTSHWNGVEQVVADARYVVQAGGDSAEFALLVHEQWQRRGVGQWAMKHLERAAQQAGLRTLVGQVLPDNLPMLGLMAHCAYALLPDPTEHGVLQARRALRACTLAHRLTSWMSGMPAIGRPVNALH